MAGFTLIELMISVFILMLISTTTVFSLQRTRYRDELNTASRLLVGDIRNIQARALAARNVLMCTTAVGVKVCEDENPAPDPCMTACEAAPPSRFGVELTVNQGAYNLFADIEPLDWRMSSAREVLQPRNLNPLGSSNVMILSVSPDAGSIPPGGIANIAFERQNGTMRIEACGDPGLPMCDPTEARRLTIILGHQKTGDMKTIAANAITGRISIEEP